MKFRVTLNSECNQIVGSILLLFAVSSWLIFSNITLAATPEQLQLLQNLSPDQLQQLKQMSPEQRAALVQQGGSTGKPVNQKTINQPAPMQSRNTGVGRLEYDMKTPTVTAKLPKEEVTDTLTTAVPIEQVSTKASEKTEVRRAFEAFARESKPMTVNTDDLQQFGYELFANLPTSFDPVTDIPVPPEYVLGPGDEIKVQMFGKENLNLALTVDREGSVSFPQIGPISLAGLSFAQAKATLAEQIKQRMIGVSASITMGQLRSIRIFALGDVFRPGSYTVSGLATLSHALFASGGVKKIGSLRNIELKRNGRKVTTIDLYDFLLKGNTSRDVRLMPGDVVFVPIIGKTVAIAGEIVRPAIYELTTEKNVGDILKLSGGLLPNAFANKALIERFNPKGDKQVVSIDLSGNGLSVPVKNGDVIKVFTATDFETNQVLLLGNVKRPGKFAWHEGMKVLDLIASRDDLLPESLMDYGIIEGEAEDTREPVMTRFKLGELMEKGKAAGELNIALNPRDRVYVFQRANFREQPKLTINGSVQNPGMYEFKRNMRLVDLVLAAGGLIRDSDSEALELYRTDPVSKEVSLIKGNLKEAMAGVLDADMLLQDMDRVVVHSIFERKQRESVSIVGEVNKPGTVELSQRMRVADLVFAAGNVTETALLTKGEITRYKIVDGDRRESEHFEIDLSKALQGDETANILLQPYDSILIRRLSGWEEIQKIDIVGEVQHPGNYPIKAGERLSSVLGRTGGYTKDAYLPASIFIRESIREEQQRQLDELAKRMDSELSKMQQPNALLHDATLKQRQIEGLSAVQNVVDQLKRVKATGRLVLDLTDLESLKGSPFDIQMRAGDKVYIPKRPDEVLVLGEVYNQSALIYEPGKSMDSYITDAGLTRLADKAEVYLVRANGRVEMQGGWFSGSKIMPGDTIVVPMSMSYFNLLDSVLDWSRATMQIATTVATLKYIGVFQ